MLEDTKAAGSSLERAKELRTPPLAHLYHLATGEHSGRFDHLLGPATVTERHAVSAAGNRTTDRHSNVEGGRRLERVTGVEVVGTIGRQVFEQRLHSDARLDVDSQLVL
eukprot:scaffold104265_cov29-Tisochrysis_lutea.AAC.1